MKIKMTIYLSFWFSIC